MALPFHELPHVSCYDNKQNAHLVILPIDTGYIEHQSAVSVTRAATGIFGTKDYPVAVQGRGEFVTFSRNYQLQSDLTFIEKRCEQLLQLEPTHLKINTWEQENMPLYKPKGYDAAILLYDYLRERTYAFAFFNGIPKLLNLMPDLNTQIKEEMLLYCSNEDIDLTPAPLQLRRPPRRAKIFGGKF